MPRTNLDVAPRDSVVVLAGSYLPGYKAGGPIRSIANIIAALGQEFRFRVMTPNRDLGEKTPFVDITPNCWTRVGKADVLYMSGFAGLLRYCTTLFSLDRRAILYLNSVFSRQFSIIPALMVRLGLCRTAHLILAPRGELAHAALQLKPRRKRFFIALARVTRLYRGVTWHASSEFEAQDVLRQFPESTLVRVASGLTGAAKRRQSLVAVAADIAVSVGAVSDGRAAKRRGQLRAVFVGRCAPMKNLAGALSMLDRISGDISLNIYGPAEDAEYWRKCKELIAALPSNVSVQYWGPVAHDDVSGVFADHDLCFFPTLGENFGHVIIESLLAGCPVLISDRTPWRDLQSHGAGWDLPLSDPDGFRSVLQQVVDMLPEEHEAMRLRAAEFGMRFANSIDVLQQNRALFTFSDADASNE